MQELAKWTSVGIMMGILCFLGFVGWLELPKSPEPPPAEVQDQELTKAAGLAKAHELIEDVFNIKIVEGFTSYTIPVTVSAYTARAEECDKTPEVTADMTPSRVGLLAVSRDLIQVMGLKFGDTVMLIDGGEFLGTFVIHDVMNARYESRVDILHSSVKSARLFGVKRGVLLIRVVGDEA